MVMDQKDHETMSRSLGASERASGGESKEGGSSGGTGGGSGSGISLLHHNDPMLMMSNMLIPPPPPVNTLEVLQKRAQEVRAFFHFLINMRNVNHVHRNASSSRV